MRCGAVRVFNAALSLSLECCFVGEPCRWPSMSIISVRQVFVPLVDMDAAVGPTEFTPGTHLQWSHRPGNVAVTAAAGSAILFDYRLR